MCMVFFVTVFCFKFSLVFRDIPEVVGVKEEPLEAAGM